MFEIPDLYGKPEEDVMDTIGLPNSAPVFTRDQSYQSDSLPKYLVFSESLVGLVDQDDLRVKMIDFGGGSFQ